MEPKNNKYTAKLAGILYLLWILLSLYGMFFIPSQISTKGDSSSIAKNILSHEFIFRTSILTDILTSTVWLFMVSVLYRLFKSINEHQAKLLVLLVIVQIPTVFVMEALNFASLKIFKGELLNAFELSQRLDLAILFHKMNGYGLLMQELFWGLWLFPLAILVYKSGFLPRFLGIWLLLNGIAYIILSCFDLLLPQFRDIVFKIGFPCFLGEIVFMLWLLIKGAKPSQVI
ncbi:MAG: DUF4386 domain-containing protein [Bacteroidales bacterium]